MRRIVFLVVSFVMALGFFGFMKPEEIKVNQGMVNQCTVDMVSNENIICD